MQESFGHHDPAGGGGEVSEKRSTRIRQCAPTQGSEWELHGTESSRVRGQDEARGADGGGRQRVEDAVGDVVRGVCEKTTII